MAPPPPDVVVRLARKSQKMEFVLEYLRIHKLPASLQVKVLNFYEHCWERLTSFPFSEHVILEELSPYLRKEVIMSMNSEMVQKVPFFKNQETDLVINLLLCLQPEIFAPSDLIFVQGEVGHEMYFLRQGQVAVGNTDMSIVYAKLYDGAYFGEVALLMHGRRTATIRAVYQSDILALSRRDMDKVLLDFPDVKQKILEVAAKANYKMEKSSSSRVLHDALEKKASSNSRRRPKVVPQRLTEDGEIR